MNEIEDEIYGKRRGERRHLNERCIAQTLNIYERDTEKREDMRRIILGRNGKASHEDYIQYI